VKLGLPEVERIGVLGVGGFLVNAIAMLQAASAHSKLNLRLSSDMSLMSLPILLGGHWVVTRPGSTSW